VLSSWLIFRIDNSGAVHHWDEYGLADHSQEPPEIQQIHAEEIAFVEAWLADWSPPNKK